MKKKVIILMVILLTLVSCSNLDKKIVVTEKEASPVENNLNNNTNEKMKDIVKKGSNIAVSYTGSLEDGTVFDATSKHGWVPLEFQAGAGQMIAGFDAGVIGMKLGETKVINIKAKEAYGEYDENKTQVLSKKDLESFIAAWVKLEKGEKFPTQMGEFEIIDTNEENITIDTNHSLAWKDLIFEVKIEKIN